MTTAEQIGKPEIVIRVPLDRLHPSPTNPRKHLGDLTNMAASIAQVGVLQPIVAREQGDDYEIAFGHKRHAGAKLAKVADVPVIVREMTDTEVLEAQIVENNGRDDPHPLDEADGFAALLKRGYTVERLAQRIGRPLSYVAQRLKLCTLSKECRKAIDDESISIGVAMLLAKLPSQKLQDEGLEAVTDRFARDEPAQMPVNEARKRLEEEVMRALKGAPFKPDDAGLVPKAGACTACPKRTGVQVALFDDASSPDLCTDPKCFREKVDAVWQIRVKKHKDAGGEVLSQKAAGQLFSHHYYGEAREVRERYKKLDDREYQGGKSVTVKSLLGKELPPITLARDPETGLGVELVLAADVKKVLKERAPARPVSTRSTAEKIRAEKDRQRGLALNLAIATAVERVDRMTDNQLVQLLVEALLLRSWNDTQQAVIRRRGLEPPATKDGKQRTVRRMPAEERLIAYLKTLDSSDDVAGLGVELALRTIAPGRFSAAKPRWGETLKAFGISFDAIEKKIAEEAKAKKAARAPKKLRAKPKAKPKAKPPKAKAKGRK